MEEQIRTLAKFSGAPNEDVVQWLQDIEEVFARAQLGLTNKYIAVQSFLTNGAAMWFKYNKRNIPDWSTFKIEIVKAFQLSTPSKSSSTSPLFNTELNNENHQLDFVNDNPIKSFEDLEDKCLRDYEQAHYSPVLVNINDLNMKIQPPCANVVMESIEIIENTKTDSVKEVSVEEEEKVELAQEEEKIELVQEEEETDKDKDMINLDYFITTTLQTETDWPKGGETWFIHDELPQRLRFIQSEQQEAPVSSTSGIAGDFVRDKLPGSIDIILSSSMNDKITYSSKNVQVFDSLLKLHEFCTNFISLILLLGRFARIVITCNWIFTGRTTTRYFCHNIMSCDTADRDWFRLLAVP